MNTLPGFEKFQLPDGEHAIELDGGWVAHFTVSDGKVTDYSLNNVDEEGSSKWFAVEPRAYSAPTIIEEPCRGIQIPDDWSLLNAAGEATSEQQAIVGFIARDTAGQIVYRLSLTNAEMKKIEYSLEGTMLCLEIDGERREFRIVQLVNANKNRIEGLVAYCYEDAPDAAVTISELEDHVVTV